MKTYNRSIISFGVALSLFGILAPATATNFQLTDSALQDCNEHPNKTTSCPKPQREPQWHVIGWGHGDFPGIYSSSDDKLDVLRDGLDSDTSIDSFCKQFVTDKDCANNYKSLCEQMQEGTITTCSLILTNLENIQKQNIDSMSKDDVNKYIQYITGLTVTDTEPKKGVIVNTTDLASLLEKLKARKATIDKFAADCNADLKKQCTGPKYDPEGTPDIPSSCASGYVHIQYLDKNWKFCPWNDFRPARNVYNSVHYAYDCSHRKLFGGCAVTSH